MLFSFPGAPTQKARGVLVGNFEEDSLRGTKLLFCGSGFKVFFYKFTCQVVIGQLVYIQSRSYVHARALVCVFGA